MTLRSSLRIAAVALALPVAAASGQTFSGVDLGAGAGAPRPNADAARAAFLLAAGAPTFTQTFEGLPLGVYSGPLDIGGGATISTVGADGGTPALIITGVTTGISQASGFNTTLGGTQFFQFGPTFNGPATLTISFASPTSAFGLFLSGVNTANGAITASFGANTFVLPDANNGVQFLGFVSPTPITSFELLSEPNTPGGLRDIIGLDDIELVSVTATPEPATLALLGSGLALVAGFARRRRVS
jgi:hypothetical protein